MADDAIGKFELTIGNSGMPGAPIFTFSGEADGDGKIGPGEGRITQALPPPMGNIPVRIESGQIRYTGLAPQNDVLVALKGSYNPDPEAPAEMPFEASATLQAPAGSGSELKGTGEFSNRSGTTKDLPATLKR